MPVMDRRLFLRRLASGLVGATIAPDIDLERLLWVPKPMIVVPAMPAVVHRFVTPDWIAHEALRMFENNLKFAKFVTREY